MSSDLKKRVQGKPSLYSFLSNQKRGQLTLFIVLAVVVVLGIGIYFSFSPSFGSVNFQSLDFDSQLSVINDDMTSCFESLYTEIVNDIGLRGGYYFAPLRYYYTSFDSDVPFYYFEGLEFVPNNDFMIAEMILAIDAKKSNCLLLLETYDLDYDYTYELSNVSITEEEVIFTTNVKTQITKDDVTKMIDFSGENIQIASDLSSLNEFARYIALSYSLNNESICVSCIDEIASSKNYGVIINDDLSNILTIEITDRNEANTPNTYIFSMTAISEDSEFEPVYVKEDSEVSIPTFTSVNSSAPEVLE